VSNYEENLRRAAEIVGEANKNKKSINELIDEKVKELRNLDVRARLAEQDNFEEITRHLSEEEREAFDEEAEDIAESCTDMLSAIADILKDPEARAGIIEELKRRTT
jgi:hypothetical protein